MSLEIPHEHYPKSLHALYSAVRNFLFPPIFADTLESPKVKEKTWKGKMAKRFKRTGSSSANPLRETENSDIGTDGNASFGVPLDECPVSSEREVRMPVLRKKRIIHL